MTESDSSIRLFTEWLLEQQPALTDRILTAIWRDGIPTSPLATDPALSTVVRLETEMLVAQFLRGLGKRQQVPIQSHGARHLARLAALHGTPLEDVVSSYRIAHGVIQDFFFQAARESGIGSSCALRVLQFCCLQLLRQTESLIDLVTTEYADETEMIGSDENALRLQAVRSLLDEAGPAPELPGYDLSAEHVAVVAQGPTAATLAAFAHQCKDEAISVFTDRNVVWAWFSGSIGPADLHEAVAERAQRGCLGAGEPGKGLAGFRRSHREAQSAFRVCAWTGRRSARFADIEPEAIGLADVDATRALVRRRLGQLTGGSARHKSLRKTLEIYLASGQNARSAAFKLGLTERTVANRLQAARALLPPDTRLSSLELGLALRLLPLTAGRPHGAPGSVPLPSPVGRQ
ncbi:PucR family transcriptional regulator [Streptomyces sp. NPDC057689]|uniref:PucR family transcriptional regulator n=1 Tax=Streptomyces sp. NPDC057689 TaxID=3346213 RepID=UPI0036756BD5